uniref:Uncharacterized protein n=1 Tax=Clastoptera arizonana TaxID=38151 RepID=A0A1B6DR75_9HEMI
MNKNIGTSVHRTRNPWSGPQPEFTDSLSNSSGSSRTYHMVHPPSENYYQEPLDATPNYLLSQAYPDHYALPRDHQMQPPKPKFGQHARDRAAVYNQQDARTRQMQGYFMDKMQKDAGRRSSSPQYDVVEGPTLNRTMRHAYVGSSRATSDRPVTPVSVAATDGGVDACGGHCVAFENFCHYCLQVLFIAGILTGISLTIAGSVLKGQKRGGDLLVLVYIGCLTAMVCTVLLSVQCCVSRNVKRRKRARRARLTRAGETIALQDMAAPQPLRTQQQYEPLLRRLVEQQMSDENQRYTAEPGAASYPIEDHSGVPWWRRETTKDFHR